MSLEEFLEERGVPGETIREMMAEKIDIEALKIMKDEELKKYLPAHGDRLAVKSFVNKTRRCSLIEKLRQSYDSFGGNNNPTHKKICLGAKKQTRKIEIGWMLYDEIRNKFKHVRGPIGGNRKVEVEKTLKAADIQKKAVELFFPGGASVYGTVEEFEMELLDYKSHKILEAQTFNIEELYSRTGLTILRFYLAVKKKRFNAEDDEYRPISRTHVAKNDGLNYSLRSRSPQPQAKESNLDSLTDESNSLEDQLPDVSVGEYLSEFVADPQELALDSSVFDLDEDNFYSLPEVAPSNVSNNIIDIQRRKDTLIVHRGHVFYEILDAMKQRNISFQNIEVEMVLPNGSSEKAEDVGGVLRDAISEFFITFYEVCTMGTEMKIPALRHDFQDKEWTAIGRIIVESCLWQNYFPIKIAPVFVKSCFGQSYNEQEILENFLQYVSKSDSSLLKNALSDFDAVDFDDILEFCSSYDGKWAPNKENFEKLITQIAIEELIQKPNYVQACWQNDFKKKLSHLDLGKIYSKYAPTDKNILSILKIPESLTEEKKRVVSFLKKYIKESDEKSRSALLRFCTGSNLANSEINIGFNSSTGLSRTPVAHTCNNLLELPTTYESFMIFRSELNNILEAGVWVMDII